MKVHELISELSKFNSNDDIFVNTTTNKHYEISLISEGCDADYNDVYIIIGEENYE
jgi:hypothetical protein|tara:strand:+ start:44 stop:211 length:168 start_codon:yes stop_codon:yes gene_type:complete